MKVIVILFSHCFNNTQFSFKTPSIKPAVSCTGGTHFFPCPGLQSLCNRDKGSHLGISSFCIHIYVEMLWRCPHEIYQWQMCKMWLLGERCNIRGNQVSRKVKPTASRQGLPAPTATVWSHWQDEGATDLRHHVNAMTTNTRPSCGISVLGKFIKPWRPPICIAKQNNHKEKSLCCLPKAEKWQTDRQVGRWMLGQREWNLTPYHQLPPVPREAGHRGMTYLVLPQDTGGSSAAPINEPVWFVLVQLFRLLISFDTACTPSLMPQLMIAGTLFHSNKGGYNWALAVIQLHHWSSCKPVLKSQSHRCSVGHINAPASGVHSYWIFTLC